MRVFNLSYCCVMKNNLLLNMNNITYRCKMLFTLSVFLNEKNNDYLAVILSLIQIGNQKIKEDISTIQKISWNISTINKNKWIYQKYKKITVATLIIIFLETGINFKWWTINKQLSLHTHFSGCKGIATETTLDIFRFTNMGKKCLFIYLFKVRFRFWFLYSDNYIISEK